MRLLTLFILTNVASSLPDWSHLVPENTDSSESFSFGPFFATEGKATTFAPSVQPSSPPSLSPESNSTYESSYPTASPTSLPQPDNTTDISDWITKTAFYQYQWGAFSEGCTYKAPRTLLKCFGGGMLIIKDLENAECESLAVDVVKCSQTDEDEDGIVDFQCIGNTPTQLAANARTFPTEATECSTSDGEHFGGEAVAAATLGRFCRETESAAALSLENAFACEEGTAGVFENDRFCASQASCQGAGCTVHVDPVSLTYYTEDEGCSTEELYQNLTDFTFTSSILASKHVVDWTFSDSAFMCDWTVPDIEIKCRNGGIPQMYQDVSFCDTSENDVITCTNPDPHSEDGRISIQLEVWCYGSEVEQLALEVQTLEAETSAFSCAPGGLLVHGLQISRGCGPLDSADFVLYKSPNFCMDAGQYHEHFCFAGYVCPKTESTSCTEIELDSVETDTSDLVVASCFYAE